eukprot:TRINITY_DN2143_c0_g1_i14.p1 TRINITY_DN2143_c0_g1~~TRINITY_DN2143_c0_g1_i14.p1  ORF type:complete len:147 (+),score=26.44 TRINITY_DN2143_c0_g1_i14:708-1148(+)
MELVSVVECMKLQKLAHRDIKPENLLLDEQWHLKPSDFGTAKSMEGDKLENRGSTFVGTAEYVSPKVLTGKESDFPSDLWALGCILYKFFAGISPFKANTEFLTLSLIVKGQVTYPPVFLCKMCRYFLWRLRAFVRRCLLKTRGSL